jgi:hypothetical protein
MKNNPFIAFPPQSLQDSSCLEDEDMQEKTTVNPVQGIQINQKFVKPKKVKIKSSSSMLPEAIDLVEKPKNTSIIRTMPRSGLFGKLREKNMTEQAPIKYGTFGIVQRMRLVKTDSVAIDLAKLRMERKGTLESKYEVLYTLGTGSYGEVQKIRDLDTDELKAVKIISKEKCSTVEKYNEEIEILKNLVTHFINYRIILMY